jgi:Xaa-Pro aminopeptidase
MKFRPEILPLRQQADIIDAWLKIRLDSLIPELMERENFDMWLVACREYNEDPVVMTMIPATSMSSRRRTILAFCRNEDGTVDRLTLSRYGYADFYEPVWNPDEEEQHECLARIIKERDPQRIGINTSKTFAFGNGLAHIEYQLIRDAVGDEIASRFESAERLCVGWLERRIPDEIYAYPRIAKIGHQIIAEAFSTQVIHPGITTTDDVVWWMRQTMHDMGLEAWFHPTIDIQAEGFSFTGINSGDAVQRDVIMQGDLLHCDMGFYYLGLATDQQQHAYVLKPNETDTPQGLKDALADGNRLQDIHMDAMRVGQTGNQVLKEALDKAKAEGIQPQVYSHPLGYHGHAAGPTIGLWDKQGGVSGNGDYELFDDTVYSVELNVIKSVPEWGGQDVRIMLEEDAILTGGKMQWLDSRQDNFYLIG